MADRPLRLGAVSLGLLGNLRLKAALRAVGARISLPVAGCDAIVVWGRKRAAQRGMRLAQARGLPVITLEDAFVRSLTPDEVPYGVLWDDVGVHYDPRQPSAIENLLSNVPEDVDGSLLQMWRDFGLSKYNAWGQSSAVPDTPFVLLIDQTVGDAAITQGDVPADVFSRMLSAARAEHPDCRIIVRRHPRHGAKGGYIPEAGVETVAGDTDPAPWLKQARAVYTVSSQMGFEAILHGRRPVVFGKPFYAGWGLSDDRAGPFPRRNRQLTPAHLADAVFRSYCRWFDPVLKAPCGPEEVFRLIAARKRAQDLTLGGVSVANVRAWKRPRLRAFLRSGQGRVTFGGASAAPARRAIWGRPETPAYDLYIEDGFLRSVGLGASLVPPLSICVDRQGCYFDPTRASDLEGLIAARATLSPAQSARANELMERLALARVTKYNLRGVLPEFDAGGRKVILCVGQVADDASVVYGCLDARTNAELVRRCRKENPDAFLIYKPHPDVVAGLRDGGDPPQAQDLDAPDADLTALFERVDAVWTLTSLAGFEALLRGLPVTCLGQPFYAGWGLTTDLNGSPPRRKARPPLLGLVHACLIDYPLYLDPVSNRICTVEHVLDMLETGRIRPQGWVLKALSKAQGRLMAMGLFWR